MSVEHSVNKKQLIVLVHGFFKGKKDMLFLDRGLSGLGYDTLSVSLPTTCGSLDDCRSSLKIQLSCLVNEYEEINFVAHSMGGLIVRAYIRSEKPSNIGKCILIATPHKGSKLADIADLIPVFSRIFRPIDTLSTQNNSTTLSIDQNIKIGLIAGTKNNLLAGKMFLPTQSDGRVEVSSVETNDSSEIILLPFGHKEIHQNHRTLLYVVSFLEHGTFDNIE